MAAYRVLVIEDNKEVRRMVTASIKALDGEIDVLDVPSAEEALLISASLPLDLVVLDIRLPGMSGLEMVRLLRKRKPETKVILVTGIDDTNIRQQVALSDVAAYFFKPIEINAFLEAVRDCLWPKQPVIPMLTEQPVETSEPSASGAPSAGAKPVTSEKPGISETPRPSEAPPVKSKSQAGEGPRVSGAPTGVPGTLGAQAVEIKPPVREPQGPPQATGPGAFSDLSAEPGPRVDAFITGTRPVGPRSFQPTVNERLTALKMQLGAASVLLVNEAGRVEEVAGSPPQTSTGFLVLPGIIQAITASQQVIQAMGRDTSESLQYFHTMKQSLYLMLAGEKHALLVIMGGYFDPDKLGIIDRAMHLATQDILAIQENALAQETILPEVLEPEPVELSAGIPVDQDALAEIEELFSTAPKENEKQEADGFWETLEENSASDGPTKKDVLSYEQAREMGLFPDDEQQP